MQKADLTTRAIAGFVDLLIIIGLSRLPDVIGFLSAAGYILTRDGLLHGMSIGKKAIGLSVSVAENHLQITYRESIIRNVPLLAAYILFLIPYVGWLLGLAALAVEWLVAVGDDRGQRIGDILARTWVVQPEQSGPAAREQTVQPAETPQADGAKQEPAP